MIKFACRCSYRFNVPDDQAGESLQCPKCGLLVDVPTIDELPGLRDDGSYEYSGNAPVPSGKSMKSSEPLPSMMSREAADRRLSLKEFLNIGTSDDDLLEIKDEVKPGIPKHPKYDPETGELILPLDIRKEKVPTPMMAIPATLGYERRQVATDQVTIFLPFAWMFRLPNVIVCAMVSLIFFAAASMTAVGTILWLLLMFVLVLIPMLVAHFANVVDETGPTGVDEMPAPLRSANLYDDFIRPFAQVVGAYALAMSPVVLLNLYSPQLHWTTLIGLSIFSHLMIPAILVTIITGGAFNNLLPSRIFSVITASGWHYWMVTAIGYVAVLATSFAMVFCLKSGFTIFHVLFVGPLGVRPPFYGLPPGLELLIAPLVTYGAMYLMHVYAWQLGLLYRLHHNNFDWVWQKHDKSERTDTQAQLHAHRQREAERKAAQASAAMQARPTREGSIPVAKPVEPRR